MIFKNCIGLDLDTFVLTSHYSAQQMNMQLLLLTAILPLSFQVISEKQQEFCTGNDNGDIWKYDLTSLGKVDKP